MITKTFAELKEDILDDLDLSDEDFVRNRELVARFNDAIEEAEAVYMNQNQDYFLTSAKLINTKTPTVSYGLVDGQADYFLPTNLYGNKVRELVYNDGINIYKINLLRGVNKFASLENLEANSDNNSDMLRYILVNNSASEGTKIKLIPTPKETGNYVTVHYIRQSDRMPYPYVGTEVIDLPMFYKYFKASVKAQLAMKEGHPRLQAIINEWQYFRELMINTTAEKTADDANEMIMDTSSYTDQQILDYY